MGKAKVPPRRKGKASGYESEVLAVLDRNKVKYKYEAEYLPYVIKYHYLPDVKLENGIYVELKGYFPPEDRRKMLAVKAAHPDKDVRIVFQYAHKKIAKRSKTTYAQWAEKHGFLWAEHRIPPRWLRERPGS